MFASIRNDALFYQDVGQGEPVVLIPGLGTTHQFFRGLTERLQQTYRVIALDLRGVGQSKSSIHEYSMEGWADDVAGVMDHLGIASAHILGSSLGGCVAQVMAVNHAERIRSLILTATFPEIDPLLELNYRVRMELIRQTGMSDLFARLAVTSLFGRSFFSTPQGQAAAAATTAAIRSNDKDTYLEHLTAVLKFGRCEPGQDRSDTFTKRLSSIRKPTLLMVGEEDVLTVPAFSRLLAEGIQGAKLVVQPRAGHLNLIEQPEDSAQLILDFLSTL